MPEPLWPMSLSNEEFEAVIARMEADNPTFHIALAELVDYAQPSTEEAAELEGAIHG
jgi:hypothetical protein